MTATIEELKALGADMVVDARGVSCPGPILAAKKAIGGLAVGLIGLVFPQTLATGYGWLQLAIEGNTSQLAIGTMLALILVKILATSLTTGSGGSGGVFAPDRSSRGRVGRASGPAPPFHARWPAALRSNTEATTTTPSSRATAATRSTVGPGIGSARSKARVSSV